MRRFGIAFLCVLGATVFSVAYWRHIDTVRTYLPIPQPVPEAVAREAVSTLIGESLVSNADLCNERALDRGLCTQSMAQAGDMPLASPSILCTTTVELDSRRPATVVTISGLSNLGTPFTTDMVLINQGDGPQFLDPVWWSGLHLRLESDRTRWTYDSGSTLCPS